MSLYRSNKAYRSHLSYRGLGGSGSGSGGGGKKTRAKQITTYVGPINPKPKKVAAITVSGAFKAPAPRITAFATVIAPVVIARSATRQTQRPLPIPDPITCSGRVSARPFLRASITVDNRLPEQQRAEDDEILHLLMSLRLEPSHA